jgi:type I restriction enzyme S subunit
MDIDGDVPEGWKKRAIREVGEVVTGRTPSTKHPEFYGEGYNLISPADLNGGKYVETAHKRLTRAGFEDCRGLPKDTVLVGCIGNVGKLGMVPDDCSATNQQINAIICNAKHDPHFIYYRLYKDRGRLESTAVKTTVPILNKTNFESFEIVVPTLTEQRKIAAVLGLVQRAIEQQERVIALTTELKKALLQKLFTEGLRSEPQKQTEIGPVPASWEIATVGRVAQVKGGKRLPKGDKFADGPTPFPYIRVTDFSEFGVDMSDLKYLRPDTHVGIKRYTISTNDIYISIAGSIGMTGMIPAELEGANLTENAAKLVITTPDIDTRFLMYFLGSDTAQSEIRSQTVKNAQPKLALARVASLKLPIPAIEEQREITAILDTLGEKQRLTKQKKKSLEHLFRTLLHQLMTAQIRVDNLDLDEILQQPVTEIGGETVNPPIVGNGRDRSLHEGSANK